MEKREFSEMAARTLDRVNSLIQSKGTEYAKGDAFSNFKNASGGLSFHDKPEMVAWEYTVKHLQSVKDIISGKVPGSNAVVDEKINDIIVYMLLIKGMMLEKNTEVESVVMRFKDQNINCI